MRVNIEHSEMTTGLLRKTTHYVVSVAVEFSDEEKHIIKSNDLDKTIVLERGVPSDRNAAKFDGMEDIFNLTIRRLLQGRDSYALSTPAEAKQYEQVLTEQLRALKNFIDENAGIEERSTTFEL